MYTMPTKSSYLRRNPLVSSNYRKVVKVDPRDHQRRIFQELKKLGMTRQGLATMESQYLPNVIGKDEHICGVLYGFHQDGYAMLVATDKKVIFLDKKPMFINEDEISYFVVSGIRLNRAGFGSVVTLHTRIKDFKIRTFNKRCADGFMRYIESRIAQLE